VVTGTSRAAPGAFFSPPQENSRRIKGITIKKARNDFFISEFFKKVDEIIIIDPIFVFALVPKRENNKLDAKIENKIC
jgi:hypothetical protein